VRTYLDCFPCFLSQALKASRIATREEKAQRAILDQVMKKLINLPITAPPPQIAQIVYRTIKTITGNEDPYQEIKKKQNELVLRLYPELKEMVQCAGDPLLCAVKLAIAGNIIDLGAQTEVKDIKKEVLGSLASSLAINDYDVFKSIINKSKNLLYLGDNAGEIVFDRILLEELKKVDTFKIFFAVREKPVINDVTLEDARFVGIDSLAEVVSNGSDAPATVLSECSPGFINIFQKADVIIAKGQGNYESLSEERKNLFFLLRVKCPVVANDLMVNIGDSIIKKQCF